MIYGPYNESGEFWTCDDHDICNGAFIEGNYVYLSTKTFPYVLGCFGPGPQQTEQVPSCSNVSCPTDDTGAVRNGLALVGLVSAIASLLF